MAEFRFPPGALFEENTHTIAIKKKQTLFGGVGMSGLRKVINTSVFPQISKFLVVCVVQWLLSVLCRSYAYRELSCLPLV